MVIFSDSYGYNLRQDFPFKMDDGLLSLKWNNHKTTFFEILKVLRDKANYTDATLAVEGKFYPVHKLVLSTCSEYFSEIFERTPCKSPVIVLKDVRSQDLESLLDYMYLGEVNVNQNDLALLLKTAECLRIKGLAVPDDDPSKHSSSSPSKTHSRTADETTRETPPAKRRKEESSAPSHLSPPQVSPSTRVSSSSPPPISSNQHNKSATDTSCSPGEEISIDAPLVKVELEEAEDGDEAFQSDTNYDSNTEAEIREFTVEKAEHDPATYPNTNFSMATTQQTGEMAWEDGENSFPPEAFGGDSSGQQAGGEEEDEEVDVTSLSPHSNSFLNLSLTQSREARRCQLCQVTLANANLLRRHVEDHHFHIRKYDCVHCGKKFKRKEHRERHERIHTGEKPFACHICTSRFTQKEHLKGHVENVHHKHLRERDKDSASNLDSSPRDPDPDRECSTSSPPSLASPSSLSSLMASSLGSMLPSTIPLSHLGGVAAVSSALSSVFSSSSSFSPSSFSSFPATILPTTTTSSSSPADDVTSASSSLMALYAPVTRKTVDSPNKHVQTITINFN